MTTQPKVYMNLNTVEDLRTNPMFIGCIDPFGAVNWPKVKMHYIERDPTNDQYFCPVQNCNRSKGGGAVIKPGWKTLYDHLRYHLRELAGMQRTAPSEEKENVDNRMELLLKSVRKPKEKKDSFKGRVIRTVAETSVLCHSVMARRAAKKRSILALKGLLGQKEKEDHQQHQQQQQEKQNKRKKRRTHNYESDSASSSYASSSPSSSESSSDVEVLERSSTPITMDPVENCDDDETDNDDSYDINTMTAEILFAMNNDQQEGRLTLNDILSDVPAMGDSYTEDAESMTPHDMHIFVGASDVSMYDVLTSAVPMPDPIVDRYATEFDKSYESNKSTESGESNKSNESGKSGESTESGESTGSTITGDIACAADNLRRSHNIGEDPVPSWPQP